MATIDAYRAVDDGAGWSDRSARVRLEVAGPDRAKFLHNLTTNDVKRLAEGSGQETFVTSPQGKTLAYGSILACAGSILLRTDPGSLEATLPHLLKYGVFDDVAIEDATSWTFEYHLAGPRAEALLEAAGIDLPAGPALSHRTTHRDVFPLRVVRESPTGRPGLTLIGPAEAAPSVRLLLAEGGAAEVDAATFDALRIEAGTPISGQDVTASHLPQEVGRDDRAINFVKGCYLGQETVARLDALGHVNRILKGARLEGDAVPPAVGTALELDGKVVGTITSSAFSTGWGAPVVLATVRVAQAGAGTRLALKDGAGVAVVADLPMVPGGGGG